MSFRKGGGLAASLLATSALSAFATPAAAQDANDECAALATEAERAACLAAAQPTDLTADEPDIVITGSRIPRGEFSSPDPVTIIDPSVGLRQGQTETAELLQTSPIAAGSVQISSVISNNFVTNGGADAQTISLRGLGAERTLVLLNGRRAGPAGTRGGVSSFDLNVLPASIVRNIEILKTGASSIYGSDAIAGVINILTKTDTEGVEFSLNLSPTQDGGGDVFNASATWGKTWDRGHLLVSADYFRREDLERNDRDFLDCAEEFVFASDPNDLQVPSTTRADLIDVRTGNPACNGTIGNLILTNNDFTGFFQPDGQNVLVAPNGAQLFIGQYARGSELDSVGVAFNGLPGITAPDNFFGLNYDGPSTGAVNQYLPLEQTQDVISQLERYTLYLDGSYEIAGSLTAYAELLYNKRQTQTDGNGQLSVFQFTGNSFLPFFFCDPTANNCSPGDAGDPFNDEFAGNFLLRPLIAYERDNGTDIDYYRGVLGLRGDLGFGNWTFDIYGQYSRSDADYSNDAVLQDSIDLQDFRTRSCVGLTTPVGNRPCVDIDFTDPRVLEGNFTPEERAYLFDEETGNTLYEQTSAEAFVAGELFDLPGGPVGVAIGAVFRRDEIDDTPGAVTLARNLFGFSSSGPTRGSSENKELYGEIRLPLLEGVPGFERLELSAAGRITQVDVKRFSDGATDDFGDQTWKLGADWQVTDWVRFRGTWGTSFRAPALFELFLEDQTGFLAQQTIDICDRYDNPQIQQQRGLTERIIANCAAAGIPAGYAAATGSATIVSGGGLGFLDPETSEAKTASIVFTPRGWLWDGGRLSVAVDYFDIAVADEITQLGGTNIVVSCYNSEFGLDDPICDQIIRAPAGAPDAFNIREVQDPYLNINSQRNRGIDVTAQYRQDLGDLGDLNLIAQMTWQIEDELELFDGQTVDLNGEAGDPQWVGDFTANWDLGNFGIFYSLDVIGGTNDRDDVIAENGAFCRGSSFRIPAGSPLLVCPVTRLEPTFYHALSVSADVNDNFQVILGLANIFNTDPPRPSTIRSSIATLGQAPVFGSQYDILGRRLFLNLRARF